MHGFSPTTKTLSAQIKNIPSIELSKYFLQLKKQNPLNPLKISYVIHTLEYRKKTNMRT